MNETILILDFGSQYTQLIARKIRELGVFAEIHPFNISLNAIKTKKPKAIILSGGPSSVYSEGSPFPEYDIFELGIPILGICYGLQLIAHFFGGKVDKAVKREYGKSTLNLVETNDPLFTGISESSIVWMSHGDHLERIPPNFKILAESENSIAVICSQNGLIYGVQFHPEVEHTEFGKRFLYNFLKYIAKCKFDWNTKSFVENATHKIRKLVRNSNVILALSGGVDSTVAAVLLHKAIGNQLYCIHIDTGLMRRKESQTVVLLFQENFNIPVKLIDSSDIFIKRLKGITDPEKKRKIIGNTFIEIFESEAKKLPNIEWLAQGTLYPDVIESTSVKGPSATIKSHHNVGGLPEKMNLKVIEPLRELFKDEVRQVGKELGIPLWFLKRHPFPGPGLATRIIGEVTPDKLEILRSADEIFLEEINQANLYDKIWQAFAVLLPAKTVGVMGDERTYENVCALRAVVSSNGMTADWFIFPPEILSKIANRITNEVKGINRVVYDITSKPPGTIEWE